MYLVEYYRGGALKLQVFLSGPVERAQAAAHRGLRKNKGDFARVIHAESGRERWAERRA